MVQGPDHALILRMLRPEPEAPDPLYLRFPFITRGPEDHIFPALVMDDWGNEIRSLRLYEWVRENGDRFPRGEIFGFEQDGRDTQVFLREMEIHARLPCYAYTNDSDPVTEGLLLQAILLEDEGTTEPTRIKRPADLRLPLSAARVSWWHIPAGARNFDLSRLLTTVDPG
jgi:hypothetical protein